MNKILIIIILLFAIIPVFGQMPTDGNYSNWNWENQNQDNWKRKNGNIWMEINPPFDPSTERIGTIVDVFASNDYTKAKGWQLVWAQFDGIYPYFILYNTHKGLVRAFFYLDTQEFNYALATLSYHDTNSPGVITFGNEYQIAADKYLDGSVASDDMISVIIPFVGSENWCSADFPIYFDPNIKNSKYDSKKWVFKFYGCDNYEIKLKGQTGPASAAQQTISGKSSDVSTSNFSATHAKLHKQLETNDKFMQQMQNSVKNITTTSPQYLQSYKTTVSSLKPIADVFSAAVGISSGVGAVLGFMKVVNGSFNDEKSTVPAAVIQYLELEGSMQIKYNLGGNTLKISGVNGSYFPAVSWSPYNCVMGYFNLEKTPTIRKTSPYEKFQFDDNDMQMGADRDGKIIWLYNLLNFPTLVAGGVHAPLSTFLGNFVKYKFEDDNKIAINNIPGLSLVDINFALVFKLTGTGLEKFNIEQKYIYCKFFNTLGQEFQVPVVNPIYKALDEGKLKIYKYDDGNDGIYVGTPELPMNKLKDIVIEIPEKADLGLRVIAKFTSNKYDGPIIFQGNYNMTTQNETAKESRLFAAMEQTNFHWTDYYNQGYQKVITLSSANSTSNIAEAILLKPGFAGTSGFSATASSYLGMYPTRGNTLVNYYNFPCSSNSRSATIDEGEEILGSEFFDSKVKVYPNPNQGVFEVSSNSLADIHSIRIFNTMGNIVYHNIKVSQATIEINVKDIAAGLYIIQTTLSDNKTYTNRIIIK